ncbi:UDP-N-acetylmuramoyl-L-alanyl-D-glutamate--2,6-diaminopimelate ligase [Patescibacteria group bacterium]|nr:UDP-N-acetylmuramoyl-L-alanyl-D-glutamate--2,6-diaminopimelate ligase [Patescibacteria group bacterium]
MLLKEIIDSIETIKVVGTTEEQDIHVLSQDSRDANLENSLYIAVSGTQTNGHKFIDSAIEKGALAVVCEQLPDRLLEQVTYIQVKDSRVSLSIIADVFYRHPSKKLKVIAVTGTNGKTTVVHYLAQTLKNLGQKPLLLSTAGDYFDGQPIVVHRHAPSSVEIIELQKTLRQYVDGGATHVCLEATSQALDQERLLGIDIDMAIFTNLGQDHLDYHTTIDNYAYSKKRLFNSLKSSAIAISNADDPKGFWMIEDSPAETIRLYGTGECDYWFSITRADLNGMEIECNNTLLKAPVIGSFNAYNVVSVYASLIELGYEKTEIIKQLEILRGVPGRMESVHNHKSVLALVDYAHSPDALKSVLETLATIPHKRILTVIGCGGDRDKTKRAPMARIAQQLSDSVIYTSDNPRTEAIQQIFDDMKNGVDNNRENYTFVESREEAIKNIVHTAHEGDIILVAGKGHEDYQIIGETKLHFDDREILNQYLNEN